MGAGLRTDRSAGRESAGQERADRPRRRANAAAARPRTPTARPATPMRRAVESSDDALAVDAAGAGAAGGGGQSLGWSAVRRPALHFSSMLPNFQTAKAIAQVAKKRPTMT